MFTDGPKLLAFAILLAMLFSVGMSINSVFHRTQITSAACVTLQECLVYEPLSR
jgi:hypothetical protein